ncbi:hypothetical protein TKK_0000870 [Trichogramma kaykai]
MSYYENDGGQKKNQTLGCLQENTIYTLEQLRENHEFEPNQKIKIEFECKDVKPNVDLLVLDKVSGSIHGFQPTQEIKIEFECKDMKPKVDLLVTDEMKVLIVAACCLFGPGQAKRQSITQRMTSDGTLFDPNGVYKLAQEVREDLNGKADTTSSSAKKCSLLSRASLDYTMTKFRITTPIFFSLFAQNSDVQTSYDKFIIKLNQLDHFFAQFLNIRKGGNDTFYQVMKTSFVRGVFDAEHGVEAILRSLHENAMDYNGLPVFLTDRMTDALVHEESQKIMCNLAISPQALIFDFYKSVSLAEVKAHVIMMGAYDFLRQVGKPEAEDQVDQKLADLKERMAKLYGFIKPKLHEASNDLWKCDPHIHVKGKTYEEFGPVIQDYLMIESAPHPFDSVKSRADGHCSQTCDDIKLAEQKGCSAWNDDGCAEFSPNKCQGKIRNCKKFESILSVCPSSTDSNRRYEYVEFPNGEAYGTTQWEGPRDCASKKVSGYTFLKLFWKCDYCQCTCEESRTDIDRFVNLREVTSDVDNNKVVTGMRLRRSNHILHIQIQQGTLLPHGSVNKSSIRWRSMKNYTVHDAGVVENVDYHSLDWDRRGFALDDVVLPTNSVVTGLKFMQSNNGLFLRLAVRSTPFDFATGKLMRENETWVFADPKNTNNALTLINALPPTSTMKHQPDSVPGQYVELVTSNFKRDLGQTVLPFIDVQPVRSKIPMPLAGAGLFHKGARDDARHVSGGFLALKMFTYDLTAHMES